MLTSQHAEEVVNDCKFVCGTWTRINKQANFRNEIFWIILDLEACEVHCIFKKTNLTYKKLDPADPEFKSLCDPAFDSYICNPSIWFKLDRLPNGVDFHEYIVLEENTLGYVDLRRPNTFHILAGSVIKGGRSWLSGFLSLTPSFNIRQAHLTDFEKYRVCPHGHIVFD